MATELEVHSFIARLVNAIAERVNGIIKDEYIRDITVKNIKQARKVLENAVFLCNNERPHNSISNLYPIEVHRNNLKTEKLWKNHYKKNPIIVNQF